MNIIQYRQFNELSNFEMAWVLGLSVLLLWHSFKFFKNYRFYKIIKNKPSIPIASSHSGYIKVTGGIVSEDSEITPFNQINCCFWLSSVEGHWEEEDTTTDSDGYSNTDTNHHSENIYNQMSDIDWITIADDTGAINFPTNSEVQNLSINKSTVYKPSIEMKNIINQGSLSKYDYLEITEQWLNEGEPATAIGQMVSEYNGKEKYLYLAPPKKKNLPHFLTAMSKSQLDKTQKGLFRKNLLWIPIALLFILDTFYLDSYLILAIIAMIVFLIIEAFNLLSQAWNFIFT